MRTVKVAAFVLMVLLLIAAGPSFAKGLQPVGDGELDGVYARGLTFMIDANTFMGSGCALGRPIDNRTFNFNGTNNFNLNNSIALSGEAQRNAFGVVNAVNSSVNMPINIVVLINSQLSGGINVRNFLSASR